MTASAGGGPGTGRLLARNSFLNLARFALPAVLGLAAIPLLIGGLGVPRFGLLTLAWAAAGYFNVFGLGLDRALAYGVAERTGEGREDEVPALVWTTLAATLALGTVAGVLLFSAAPPLVIRLLRVPPELAGEGVRAFRILAFVLPFVVSALALAGVLQARQRFGLLAAVGIPSSVWSYLGPLAVLPFSRSLVAVVAVLAAGRVLTWAAYLALCLRVLPEMRRRPTVRARLLSPLAAFGGWMSVTNVVSPLMTHLDRFFVGSLVSVSAVAYYAAPQEASVRLGAVSGAVAYAAFPGVAAAVRTDPERASLLVNRALTLVFLLLFPAALLLAAFAPEALGAWLGEEFAERSTPVLRILAAGLLLNGMAMVPSTSIQAAGRPDLTAKLHLVELPAYLAVLALLATHYGIAGAAAAWTIRVAVDAGALAFLAGRHFPGARPAIRRGAWVSLGGVAALFAASVPPAPVARAAVAFLALVAFAGVGWWWMLGSGDRAWVRGRTRRSA